MGFKREKISDSKGNLVDIEPLSIYIVRHAQPQWSVDGIGIDEPHLTALGYRQAEALGQALCHLPVTDFYVSNLLRARETAAPLARLLGREPEIIPWFQEIQAKPLDGLPQEEVDAYITNWYKVSLSERFIGVTEGETMEHLHARLSAGLDDILQRAGFGFHADGRYRVWDWPNQPRCVVLVGHCFAGATAMQHLMNIDYTGASGEQLRQGWAAYTQLVPMPLGGGFVWRMKEFDQRGHLSSLGLACDDVPGYEV